MITIPTDKFMDVTVEYRDAAGNVTSVDGAPVWESSDPAIVAVEATADGLGARLTTVGPVGTAQVTVRADAARDSSVRELIVMETVEAVAADAAIGIIQPGPIGSDEPATPPTP